MKRVYEYKKKKNAEKLLRTLMLNPFMTENICITQLNSYFRVFMTILYKSLNT